MATLRTQWQRIQNYIWLVCGMVCLFAALIFWAITDSEALVEVEKSAETESELQIQPEKVAATSLLGALQEEVRPLQMTTRVVTTGSYEPEFRGSKFINENKNPKDYSDDSIKKLKIATNQSLIFAYYNGEIWYDLNPIILDDK